MVCPQKMWITLIFMEKKGTLMKELNLRLPWPPSVNRMWATTRSGNWYSTKVCNEFKNAVYRVIESLGYPHFEHKDKICVMVYAFPADARKRDLDNIFKVLGDALQEANVYDNDVQIKKIYMEMMDKDPEKRGYIDVILSIME